MAERDIRYHGNAFSIHVRYSDLADLARTSDAEIEPAVRQSASGLLFATCAAAPVRSGALQSGLIIMPGREKSAIHGKVVNDIVFDAAKNETFVKHSKAGARYYYPASQEYGFKLRNGKRQPGLYYMRNTANAYYATHEENMVREVMKMLEDL